MQLVRLRTFVVDWLVATLDRYEDLGEPNAIPFGHGVCSRWIVFLSRTPKHLVVILLDLVAFDVKYRLIAVLGQIRQSTRPDIPFAEVIGCLVHVLVKKLIQTRTLWGKHVAERD